MKVSDIMFDLKQENMINILIAEYLSKCSCCDECFAETFCILENRKISRKPYEKCRENIKAYLEKREGLKDE